jgi:hypothetical protein
LKSLDWRGFCKKCLQNLERQGVEGQNFDIKELRPILAAGGSTAFALAMIRFSGAAHKVRCHIGLWKNADRD